MFLLYRKVSAGLGGRTYLIKDSEFEELVSIPLTVNVIKTIPEILIVKAYQNKGMEKLVARNIALFYMSLINDRSKKSINNDIIDWTNQIENDMPELNYRNKYYNCIVNQFNKLAFSKKFPCNLLLQIIH
jgi:hypothetical protein